MPEVVEHGLTGFIVDDEAAAADAIDNQLRQLSRQKIRARFEERFTARRMAGEYLEIYRELMAGAKRRLRTVNGAKHDAQLTTAVIKMASMVGYIWRIESIRSGLEWSIRGPRAMSA